MALQDLKDLSTALKIKEKELRGLLMASTRSYKLKRHIKNGNVKGITELIQENSHDNRHGQNRSGV